MPDLLLLGAGVAAVILGWIEFKLHPIVGIVTQVVAGLIALAVFISALGYGGGFLAFWTANLFLTYITVISLGLFIGNAVAEFMG